MMGGASMRCRSCGTRWHLRDELGPGGNASPGQYLCVSLGILAVAVVLLWFSIIATALVGALAALVLFMGCCGCGYKQRATAYQGSECPSCGRINWIWPWHF